jgi:hypothetical protein
MSLANHCVPCWALELPVWKWILLLLNVISALTLFYCTDVTVHLQGYLCHPYLSLPYLDLLSDVNVRGYLVGATNILFKQKHQLADVLVEVRTFAWLSVD